MRSGTGTALLDIGFEKDALKTTNFKVRTDYNSIKDQYGNYTQKFNGYIVSHQLKLEFDFNTERLFDTLSAIASCPSYPKLKIAFTVKDKEAVSDKLLCSAAINAKRKATILCEAVGVTLADHQL